MLSTDEPISEASASGRGGGGVDVFSNENASWGVRSESEGEYVGQTNIIESNNPISRGQTTNMVGTIEITLLGIALVIVGDTAFWNTGLGIGYYDYLTNTILLGIAFICSSLCLAEMTATFPFAGGIYGFTRVTLGPYFGFIVGCCEMLQNIVYCSAYVIFVGEIFAFCLGIEGDNHDKYAPLFAFAFLVFITIVNLVGGRWFWHINSVFSILAIVVVLLYIFSSFGVADFGRYKLVDHTISINQRVFNIFSFFAPTAWFYGGIEMLPLACSDALKPRSSVSRAIVITAIILFVFAICLLTISASLSPGPLMLQFEILPLVPGLMQSLGLTAEAASALMIPGIGISAMAFIYIYGKQIRSMSESHLVPSILHHHYGKHQIPFAAILGGSLLCFFLIFVYYFVSIDFFNGLVLVSNQASYLLYISIPVSYCIFKQRYDKLAEDEFKSPLGIYGAIYSLFMLLVANFTVLTMQDDVEYLIPGFLGYYVLISLYYFLWAMKRQGFSPEEQKVLFSAYIINANRRSRHHAQHHHHHHHKTRDNKRKSSSGAERSVSSHNKSSSASDHGENSNERKPQREDDDTIRTGKMRRFRGLFWQSSENSVAMTESTMENSISYVRRLLSLRQATVHVDSSIHSTSSSHQTSVTNRNNSFHVRSIHFVNNSQLGGNDVQRYPFHHLNDGNNQNHLQVAGAVDKVHAFSEDNSFSKLGTDMLDENLNTSTMTDTKSMNMAVSVDPYLVEDRSESCHPASSVPVSPHNVGIGTSSKKYSIVSRRSSIGTGGIQSTSPNSNHQPLTRLETVSGSSKERALILVPFSEPPPANSLTQGELGNTDKGDHTKQQSPPVSYQEGQLDCGVNGAPLPLFQKSRSTGLRSSGDSSSSEGGPMDDGLNGIRRQSLISVGSEMDEYPLSVSRPKPSPPQYVSPRD